MMHIYDFEAEVKAREDAKKLAEKIIADFRTRLRKALRPTTEEDREDG